MTGNIARPLWAIVSAVGLAALAACGARPPAAPPGPRSATVRTLPLEQVLPLESTGPRVNDTIVRWAGGEARTILLQHADDHVPFAELRFPAAAFPDSGQPVTVTVRPDSARYGLTVTSDRPWLTGAAGPSIVFKYPVHFRAPDAAGDAYRATWIYERALGVARLRGDRQVDLLATTRPGTDQLQAPLLGEPGRYFVAAPLP